MIESTDENSHRKIIDDENHNYLQIGLQPVDATNNKHTQMLDKSDISSTLTSFILPTLGIETNNVSVIQEEIELTKNCTNVGQKEKSDNVTSENEKAVNEKDVSSNDDEPIAPVLNMNNKNDDNVKIWEGLRNMFPCNKCSYGAKKKYLLLRHLRTHREKSHDKNKQLCNNQTTDYIEKDNKKSEDFEKKILATTIKNNSEEEKNYIDSDEDKLKRSFACTECPYNSKKRYLLLRHSKIHSGLKPYTCIICERGFTAQSSLQAHVNVHYGVKNHICKYCGTSFTTSGELIRHVKYKHTQEKPHKCTECDYAAVERSKLKRHMRYHTGERPYQCQHCTYASQDMYHLKRHIRSHTGEKPYKCDNCNASYAHSTTLKLHKHVHNPFTSKVFYCELCPTSNVRKSELHQHFRRMHYSDKLLKCKRCGEIFSDRYSYSLHTKIHKNEKNFKCQLCSFTAKKFTYVERHMIKHREQKSIQTDQSFNSNSFLRGPNKTYLLKDKPFECQKCKRKFAYQAALTRHRVAHDNENTFEQK